MDLHQIHMEDMFVPRSDEFEGQGQKSRSPAIKTGLFGPFGGLHLFCLVKHL